MKITKHRPPHITGDNTSQFITARCYSNIPYLGIIKDAKNHFIQKMKQYAKELKINTDAWIILNNHYHLLLNVTKGGALSEFIRKLHGAVGNFIRKNEPDLVTVHGQVIKRPETAWDRRQWKRYEERIGIIEELKNSGPSVRDYRAINCAILKTKNSGPSVRDQQESRSKLRYSSGEKRIANFSSRLSRNKLRYSNQESRSKLRYSILKQLQEKDIDLKTTRLNAEIISLTLIKSAPIWYQYINRIITSEKDYFSHFNYIHQNPVKHGYIKKPFEYKWSSIYEYDKNYVMEAFEGYPIVDYEPEWDT